jgi:hypothetical protein
VEHLLCKHEAKFKPQSHQKKRGGRGSTLAQMETLHPVTVISGHGKPSWGKLARKEPIRNGLRINSCVEIVGMI